MKRLLTPLALVFAALLASGAGKVRLTDATGSGLAAFGRHAFDYATKHGVEFAYFRLEVSAALEKLALGETDVVLLNGADLPKDFSGGKTVCAYRPLVAVVSLRNPVRGITRDRLKRLLAEPQPDWSFAGISGMPVRRAALRSDAGGPAGIAQLKLFRSAPGILLLGSLDQLWTFVGPNPAALAVAPFGGDLPDGLAALKIDGVAPTRAAVRSKTYPLTEEFCAVTAAEPPKAVRELVAGFGTRDFSDLLEEEGALAPLPGAAEN